jgi:hypothetical protein
VTEATDDLRKRFEQDPDAVVLSEATDKTLSIGRDVWRLRWRGQLATAVAADANLATTCGALLDVLALLDQQLSSRDADPLLDLATVNVIVDRPLPGDPPTETDEALRSLRQAIAGVGGRVWYRRADGGWIEDTARAPAWPENDPRITRWVEQLLLPRLTSQPTQLALDLVAAVDDPSLHMFPSEIRAGAPARWALRVDGLEIAVVDDTSGVLTVGQTGAAGDSSQRKAFVSVFGHPSVTVETLVNGTGTLDVATAAGKIRSLLLHFRAADVRGAPVSHRTKNGVPIVDEHALGARLLKGIVPAPEGTGLVLDDDVVARGSQFPTLWGQTASPRYLDALMTRGTTPLAVELKVATGGQGRYYRRSLLQAVLYAHFIRNAPALDPWFAAAGIDRTETVPVIGMPAPGRWTPGWEQTLDGLRALAHRVGAEVWVLDERATPDWTIHADLPEPDIADLERHTWRLAAALSSLWPKALGRTVNTHPLDGFYDRIELRHRQDHAIILPHRATRVAVNRPGSLWVVGPAGTDRWVWRGIWSHIATGADPLDAARIIGAMAGLPAEQQSASTFPVLAAAFLDAVDDGGWNWRCAWPDGLAGDLEDRFRSIVRRYRTSTTDTVPATLPTRARLWVAVRDDQAEVLVDQQDLRLWAWNGTAVVPITDADPVARIKRAATVVCPPVDQPRPPS